jgi:hypothetical protein
MQQPKVLTYLLPLLARVWYLPVEPSSLEVCCAGDARKT